MCARVYVPAAAAADGRNGRVESSDLRASSRSVSTGFDFNADPNAMPRFDFFSNRACDSIPCIWPYAICWPNARNGKREGKISRSPNQGPSSSQAANALWFSHCILTFVYIHFLTS